jgi:hypothetical protein
MYPGLKVQAWVLWVIAFFVVLGIAAMVGGTVFLVHDLFVIGVR